MGEESLGPGGAPAGAVFLSYASQDAEAARRICAALKAAGIEVWFDESELRGGDVWDRNIRDQIHHCRLFIPIISATTEARDEGYFRREWGVAADRTRDMAEKRPFLLPVVIDDTTERGASVPEKFFQFQWTRLPAGATPPAFVARVAALLDPQRAFSGARPSSATVPLAARPPRSSRFALWLALVASAVGIAVAGVWFASHSPHAQHAAKAPPSPGDSRQAVTVKSIAVLPFVDMSEKHDQEYFADGMAEEILDVIAKIPGLTVIGRTSSFSFKGRDEDLRSIGAKLGAAYVLEGSIRKSNDQIRITTQLINTRSGAREWSENYDRHIGDVLKLEDAIAAAVARALQLTVADRLSGRFAPTDARSYDMYLRGRHALDRHDREGLEEAVTLFTGALERDPAFVAAAVSLSWARGAQAQLAFAPPAIAFEQAREAAERAIAIDPSNTEARSARANVSIVYDWDWAAAERELKLIENSAPGSIDALFVGSKLASALGLWSEASRQVRAEQVQDPLDPDLALKLARLDALLGRFNESEVALRRLLEARPSFGWAHYYLGLTLLARGNRQLALQAVQQESAAAAKQQGLAIVYFALGRKADADAALAAMLKDQAEINAIGIADVYAIRGETGEAFRWLERARLQKDSELWYIKSEYELKGLAKDPRYAEFLRKMNLAL